MTNNDLYCSKCKSHHHPVECPEEATMTNEELVAKFEEDFTNPYPEDIFIPPTEEQLKKAHEVLKKYVGIPIDKITGHIGRHTWKWLTRDFKDFLCNLPTSQVGGMDGKSINEYLKKILPKDECSSFTRNFISYKLAEQFAQPSVRVSEKEILEELTNAHKRILDGETTVTKILDYYAKTIYTKLSQPKQDTDNAGGSVEDEIWRTVHNNRLIQDDNGMIHIGFEAYSKHLQKLCEALTNQTRKDG